MKLAELVAILSQSKGKLVASVLGGCLGHLTEDEATPLLQKAVDERRMTATVAQRLVDIINHGGKLPVEGTAAGAANAASLKDLESLSVRIGAIGTALDAKLAAISQRLEVVENYLEDVPVDDSVPDHGVDRSPDTGVDDGLIDAAAVTKSPDGVL